MVKVGIRLSFWAMIGWVVLVPMLVAAAGVWPTHLLAGAEGLKAQAAAAVIVMPVILVSSLVILCLAQRGPATVTTAFIAAGVTRAMIVVIVGLGAWHMLHLRSVAFLGWLGVLYLVGLASECLWLARALQRDAFLVALGKVNR